ncbi:hypothetical protein BHE74_00001646 [Ensete ventricosum]|nr:hypothetical protein BHE74_00001646 [Ensete ventricosum]
MPKVGVSCSGAGGPTIIGPIILSPPHKSFLLCSYGAYPERIVVELRSLEYVVGELIDLSIVACYSWVGYFSHFGLTMAEMRDLGMIQLVAVEMCNSGIF